MALTEDERAAIDRHLYECKPADGMKYQSSLIAILNEGVRDAPCVLTLTGTRP